MRLIVEGNGVKTYLIADQQRLAEGEGILLAFLRHVYVLQNSFTHLPGDRQVVRTLPQQYGTTLLSLQGSLHTGIVTAHFANQETLHANSVAVHFAILETLHADIATVHFTP